MSDNSTVDQDLVRNGQGDSEEEGAADWTNEWAYDQTEGREAPGKTASEGLGNSFSCHSPEQQRA